jgi:hypothetical protein
MKELKVNGTCYAGTTWVTASMSEPCESSCVCDISSMVISSFSSRLRLRQRVEGEPSEKVRVLLYIV